MEEAKEKAEKGTRALVDHGDRASGLAIRQYFNRVIQLDEMSDTDISQTERNRRKYDLSYSNSILDWLPEVLAIVSR